MKTLQDLNQILFDQVEKLMIDDNFNDDNGKFDKKLLDVELSKTESIINLSKQIIEVSSTQLNAVKVAAEWNYKKADMPTVLGISAPKEV